MYVADLAAARSWTWAYCGAPRRLLLTQGSLPVAHPARS